MIDSPGFRAHATQSVVVIAIVQAYRVGLAFVAGILLARLLLPEDFGLVAMVSACLAFAILVQDLGLNLAIVQRENLSQAQLSAIYWLMLGASAAVSLAFAASAPLIAWFFAEPRLTALTIAFASLIFLTGSQSTQMTLLSRDFRFNTLSILAAIGTTIQSIVSVLIAWSSSSYWSLFFGNLGSYLVVSALLWVLCNFRPSKPSFEGSFWEIIQLGTGVSGFNILNYFSRNADNLLIGHYYGSELLGFYDRAYRLLLYPITQVFAPLVRIVVPILARLQSEPDRYRMVYGEATSLLMMAMQPGLVFLVVFANDFFLILLGPHWLPSAPIFRWLGCAGVLQMMNSTLGWLFMSQGRGGDFFKLGVFNGLITVSSFVVGLPWGPLGVAASYTVANYTFLTAGGWWSASRRGPIRVYDLAAISLPHAGASILCAAILIFMHLVLPSPRLLPLIGLGILSYGSYAVFILMFPAKRRIVSKNIAALLALAVGK